MREEKKELKKILNEEFGLFRKDSTISGDGTPEEPAGFIIEWEEESDSISKVDIKPDNNSDKERFIIEWDDDEEEKQDESVGESKKKRRKKKK